MQRRLPARARSVSRVEGHALQRLFSEFALVLRQPWAQVVTLTVFLEGAFLFGAFAFMASHLHLTHGLSLSTAGSVVMLFGFGGFLFAACSHFFVRWLGETGLACWGGIAMFVSLLAIALLPAWWYSLPACFTAGLGFYMLHNTLQRRDAAQRWRHLRFVFSPGNLPGWRWPVRQRRTSAPAALLWPVRPGYCWSGWGLRD